MAHGSDRPLAITVFLKVSLDLISGALVCSLNAGRWCGALAEPASTGGPDGKAPVEELEDDELLVEEVLEEELEDDELEEELSSGFGCPSLPLQAANSNKLPRAVRCSRGLDNMRVSGCLPFIWLKNRLLHLKYNFRYCMWFGEGTFAHKSLQYAAGFSGAEVWFS